jgi:hypothetical protein
MDQTSTSTPSADGGANTENGGGSNGQVHQVRYNTALSPNPPHQRRNFWIGRDKGIYDGRELLD